ncbi:putative protein phosphatase 2C 76 [Waddlia chondrophila 2032/99]|uniref:PPM-type phosphatase domain-containing protein n=2 Tax=Waddlia chondrophila TaxID=71667 RepID=F8LDE1_9BACT|nr:PP2C family protein-serine/threonine phosphatase [Waddlia chondrophila]ADI38334.1 putative serine/threonine PP2C protein phosphatase [Waddlia chondrophila WSU 86-1044]CCB91417.1 putative protein phosphatase 2C 76 [Waddlia chondrophila 2032/99]
MDVDPENALRSAKIFYDKKDYNKAMEFFVKAAFSLIYNSKEHACTKTAMEKAIDCYLKLNPAYTIAPHDNYIQQYFTVVRHWQDHRKWSEEQICQELFKEIPCSLADDSREELPMGATFSRQLNSSSFDAAIAAGQGIREEMEDAFVTEYFSLETASIDLFAVFDGHGGKTCAQYTAEELPKQLKNRFNQLAELNDEHIYQTLIETCVSIDESWKQLSFQVEGWKDISGTTAAIALYINQKELWVANVGDSGAVINLNGKAIQLTEAAKPTHPRYYQEIYMRGGIVSYGRVDASLDMARSIGDLPHPSVSARPTVKKIEIDSKDHTLIIACDGLWDVIEGQTAVDSIKGKNSLEAAEHLRTLAYQRGSTDNVSIIVVINQ